MGDMTLQIPFYTGNIINTTLLNIIFCKKVWLNIRGKIHF